MNSAVVTQSSSRQIITWMLLLVTLTAVICLFNPTSLIEKLGVGDFIAYWSAGRALAEGANPYDWQTLLALQQPLGWTEAFPNMMYYPPWVLPIVLPLGAMPFPAARLLWLVLNAGIVVGCADWLWRYFGGPVAFRGIAWIISLAFVPTLLAFQMGQIGPLLLLGIVAFLHFERRGCDWLAGAALALAAIKPQLVYLFGLAVLFWAVERRRWNILLGGALTLVIATLLAMVFDPQLLAHYRYALTNPPSDNITPTIGAMLRLIFGAELSWLQYVPTLAGVMWFIFYWVRHRKTWNWSYQAPIMVMVSFLTTAYGAWVFDLVVLLLPILQVAVWVFERADRRALHIALICGGVIDGVALAMNIAEATYPAFIWMTPTILIGYLVFRRKYAVVA